MPLMIDSIVPATGYQQPHYEVRYSLSRLSLTPRWETATVPAKLSMVEVDWFLRNHWARMHGDQFSGAESSSRTPDAYTALSDNEVRGVICPECGAGEGFDCSETSAGAFHSARIAVVRGRV